jgi:hypothetical protein
VFSVKNSLANSVMAFVLAFEFDCFACAFFAELELDDFAEFEFLLACVFADKNSFANSVKAFVFFP